MNLNTNFPNSVVSAAVQVCLGSCEAVSGPPLAATFVCLNIIEVDVGCGETQLMSQTEIEINLKSAARVASGASV